MHDIQQKQSKEILESITTHYNTTEHIPPLFITWKYILQRHSRECTLGAEMRKLA